MVKEYSWPCTVCPKAGMKKRHSKSGVNKKKVWKMKRRLLSLAAFLFVIYHTRLVRQTLSHFSQNMVIFVIKLFANTKQKITGPLTEISVPIDRLSRKMKGYACVTFMVPENAVKAYSELDGKVFQGRMLHLLPGKTKKSYSEMAEEGTKSIHLSKFPIDLFNFLLLESLFKYFFYSRGFNLQTEASAEAESPVRFVSQLERLVLGPECSSRRHGESLQHVQGASSRLREQRECGGTTGPWWNPTCSRYKAVPRAKWRQSRCVQSGNRPKSEL